MQREQDRSALQNELPDDANDSSSVRDGNTASHPMLVIVMGVSSCGKSTLGRALADALQIPFIEVDDLHPPSNIDKMSDGIPLTDEDRKPWLELIRTRAEHLAAEQQQQHAQTPGTTNASGEPKTPHGLVVACSSLERRYRSILRGHEEPDASALPEGVQPPHPDVLSAFFVYIKGEREALLKRISERKGHFMKAGMLESQLATLESPEGEKGVVTVRLEDQTEQQVTNAVEGLKDLVGAELDVSS